MQNKGAFFLWPCVGALAATLLLLAPSAGAYSLGGDSWTRNRTVVMQLSLGGSQLLSDGSTSFNQVAQDALNIWNPYLPHLRFSAVANSPVPPAEYDDEMSVFFSNKVFGDDFDTNTLAITLTSTRNHVIEETDVVFNNAYTWDSYRGPLRNAEDFRRVAIHEFGHTLGLDHPDEAKPSQNVSAIMNSIISNLDTVQADDIAGAQAIYSSGPPYQTWNDGSILRNISTRAAVGTGDNVLIGGFVIQGSQPATVIVRGVGYSLREFGIVNALTDPTITVYNGSQQQIATNDDWFIGANAQTIASYGFDPRNSIESALLLTLQPGNYTVIVRGFSDSQTPAGTGVALFELYDLHTTSSRAGNISSRGQVLTGDGVMIGGFVVGGAASKQVVIRAIGPTLAASGVVGSLADPTLTLYDANGAALQTNDDWQSGPDAQTISIRGLGPGGPRESALLATLPPGNYTAIIRGVNNTTGIALVEVYDSSPLPP